MATFTIGGNFTVKNFSPFSEPGVGNTGVYLRNVTAAGTDTCGTFYCYNGDIANSIFNGNMNLIADSSQTYLLNNASFLGASNLFQSGTLDVKSCSFGQPAAGKTILRAAHNVPAVVFFREGNNKFLGDIQLEANATLPGGTTIQQTFYGKDTCFGNLIINLSGSSNIYLANSENLYIAKGLFLNNNSTTSGVIHYYGVTAIYFIGIDTADYSYSGSGIAPAILNIVMDKRGGLRLQSPLTYTGNLTLARGVILSSALNPLTIPYGAATSVAWDSSYVDGPVIRTGNTAFTFPLGKNNVYAPISIMPPSLVTDAFKAQYLNSNAHLAGFDSSKHDLTLNHISPGEYWLLDRTNGTATPKVLLSWKAKRSGVVNVMNDLRVARWNGTTWKDEGNGGTTGNNEEGTIQSFNDFSDFSPFTLASSSINNPLPVSFVLFNAILRADRTVLLQWQTELEINNAWFEVQKSTDGINWVTLSIMFPKPLHEYEAIDNTAAYGMNYYRVKQVDINGKYIYTIIKTVRVSRDNKIFLWPNPVSDNLNIQAPFTKGTIEIVDASGRVVMKDMIINAITTIPVKQLSRGGYLVRIRYEGEVYIEKFIRE
jgi:Secretion system C-terminal sorting domain